MPPSPSAWLPLAILFPGFTLRPRERQGQSPQVSCPRPPVSLTRRDGDRGLHISHSAEGGGRRGGGGTEMPTLPCPTGRFSFGKLAGSYRPLGPARSSGRGFPLTADSQTQCLHSVQTLHMLYFLNATPERTGASEAQHAHRQNGVLWARLPALLRAVYFTRPRPREEAERRVSDSFWSCPRCPRLGVSKVTDFIHCPALGGVPLSPWLWVRPDDC